MMRTSILLDLPGNIFFYLYLMHAETGDKYKSIEMLCIILLCVLQCELNFVMLYNVSFLHFNHKIGFHVSLKFCYYIPCCSKSRISYSTQSEI